MTLGWRLWHAARRLSKRPSFLLVAVAVLSVCFAVNTALLSFLASLLVLPQPGIADPGHLVQVFERDSTGRVTYPTASRLRELSDLRVSGARFASYAPALLRLDDAADGTVTTEFTSPDYFAILGTSAGRGRLLSSFDTSSSSSAPPAVMSWRLWEQRFHADPDIVGRRVRIQPSIDIVIVGVAARDFHGTEGLVQADLWLPQGAIPDAPREPRMLARIAPATTVSAVTAQLNAEWSTLDATDGGGIAGPRARRTSLEVKPLHAGLHPENAPTLRLLLGGAFAVSIFVLVLAVVNVGALQYSRSLSRRREITIRRALGEGRRSIIFDVVLETLIVFVAGAAIGFPLAPVTGVFLVRALATPFAFDLPVHVDMRIVVAVALMILISAAVAALVPSARAASIDPAASLRADTLAAIADRGARRVQSGFLVAQLAFAFVIVTVAEGSALDAHRIAHAGLGVSSADRVVVVPLAERSDSAAAARFAVHADQLVQQLTATAGTRITGFAYGVPGSASLLRLFVRSGERLPVAARAGGNVVTPGFFAAAGIHILAGRGFAASDGATAERVVVVSRALSRLLSSRGNPIGAIVYVGDDSAHRYRVIGIATDVRYDATVIDSTPVVYLAGAQFGERLARRNIVLRSPGPIAARTLRALAAVTRAWPIVAGPVLTIDEMRARSGASQYAAANLLLGAAALCLLLAVLGNYGLVSYMVKERRREIGLRAALGASPVAIFAMFGKRVAELTVAGIVAGGFGLYAVYTLDAPTFVAARAIWMPAAFAAMLLGATTLVTAFGIVRGPAADPPSETLRDA